MKIPKNIQALNYPHAAHRPWYVEWIAHTHTHTQFPDFVLRIWRTQTKCRPNDSQTKCVRTASFYPSGKITLWLDECRFNVFRLVLVLVWLYSGLEAKQSTQWLCARDLSLSPSLTCRSAIKSEPFRTTTLGWNTHHRGECISLRDCVSATHSLLVYLCWIYLNSCWKKCSYTHTLRANGECHKFVSFPNWRRKHRNNSREKKITKERGMTIIIESNDCLQPYKWEMAKFDTKSGWNSSGNRPAVRTHEWGDTWEGVDYIEWHRMKLTDIDLVKVERNFDCIAVYMLSRYASGRVYVPAKNGRLWRDDFVFSIYSSAALHNLMLPKCISFFLDDFFRLVNAVLAFRHKQTFTRNNRKNMEE